MSETIMVFEHNGIPKTTSRIVAELFGKRHDNVLKDIEELRKGLLNFEESDGKSRSSKLRSENERDALKFEEIGSNIWPSKIGLPNKDFWLSNFGETYYTNRGKKYPEYLLTKDGFTLLVMGYTGAKAMQFKIAYINAFNRMEETLRNGAPITPTPTDFLEACGVIPPTSPEPSDKEIAIQFLQAIEAALKSGEYYLLYKHCRKPEAHEGTLLGVYDGDIVTLISSRAYEVYKTVNNHLHIKTLWDKLISSGLALPRIEADRNRLVRGNACCVIRIQRQAANAISGFTAPALLVVARS